MRFRVLSASDIHQALPMAEAIDVVRTAFVQLATGKAVMPLRGRLECPAGDTLFMPAYLSESHNLCVKIVSVFPDNPSRDLPTISGLLLAMDPDTGLVRAIMDSHALTGLRTGAAGGVAADVLARPDARVVALFGAGDQAKTQLEGVLQVRSIECVYLLDPLRASAERFANEVAAWPGVPEIRLDVPTDEAVRGADIVITATTSSTPVFNGNDLKPGTHITSIGSYTPEAREVDETAVRRCRVIVDSRDAAATEAGDLIQAGVEPDAELGEVLAGLAAGRENDEQLTFFKSVGVAVQDAAAAGAVLATAEKLGLGQDVAV